MFPSRFHLRKASQHRLASDRKSFVEDFLIGDFFVDVGTDDLFGKISEQVGEFGVYSKHGSVIIDHNDCFHAGLEQLFKIGFLCGYIIFGRPPGKHGCDLTGYYIEELKFFYSVLFRVGIALDSHYPEDFFIYHQRHAKPYPGRCSYHVDLSSCIQGGNLSLCSQQWFFCTDHISCKAFA